jgi:hypothetical protein
MDGRHSVRRHSDKGLGGRQAMWSHMTLQRRDIGALECEGDAAAGGVAHEQPWRQLHLHHRCRCRPTPSPSQQISTWPHIYGCGWRS